MVIAVDVSVPTKKQLLSPRSPAGPPAIIVMIFELPVTNTQVRVILLRYFAEISTGNSRKQISVEGLFHIIMFSCSCYFFIFWGRVVHFHFSFRIWLSFGCETELCHLKLTLWNFSPLKSELPLFSEVLLPWEAMAAKGESDIASLKWVGFSEETLLRNRKKLLEEYCTGRDAAPGGADQRSDVLVGHLLAVADGVTEALQRWFLSRLVLPNKILEEEEPNSD